MCLRFRFFVKIFEIAVQYSGSCCRFKRATDEGSLAEIAQYSPLYLPLSVFTASKGSNLYILFPITAAGVVPCGGRKKSPRTSSIVQIIFI